MLSLTQKLLPQLPHGLGYFIVVEEKFGQLKERFLGYIRLFAFLQFLSLVRSLISPSKNSKYLAGASSWLA